MLNVRFSSTYRGGDYVALVFEYEKDITTGEQPFISHEPDSTLYNYFIDNDKVLDTNASINNGVYDDVAFDSIERHLTTKAASHIGVKNFPGIGGIGFYTDKYSEESRILAPIHSRTVTQVAPTLKTVDLTDDGMLHIIITPPSDLKYTCYRVIVAQKPFAFEYILYKEEDNVDLPTVKGTYTIYCIGYDEDNGTISEPSNEFTLSIAVGANDWKPYIDEVTTVMNDLSTVTDNVTVIQTEIKDYSDEDIHESVAKVIAMEEVT